MKFKDNNGVGFMQNKKTENKSQNEVRSHQKLQTKRKNLKRVFEILARRPFY